LGSANYIPGMQPPQHRWINPFQQRNGEGSMMGSGYPPFGANNGQPPYDQRFMNGPNGQADMVIGLQCQVQSLMRAVTALQSQLASQNQAQSSQRPLNDDSHGEASRTARINSSDRKSPDRAWSNNMMAQQELGQVSGTSGNPGSFDMFNSNGFANPMMSMSVPTYPGTNFSITSSIDLGAQSFDGMPFPHHGNSGESATRDSRDNSSESETTSSEPPRGIFPSQVSHDDARQHSLSNDENNPSRSK
jgi:hypothetical protein